jgi:hypothetical protein
MKVGNLTEEKKENMKQSEGTKFKMQIADHPESTGKVTRYRPKR